jgi:hypothetical protein
MQLSYLSKLIWLYVMFCVMLLTIVKVFWVINIARELSWVTCTTHPNWVPRAITPTNMKLSELNGSFYGVKIYIFMFWFSHSRVAWWWLFFFFWGGWLVINYGKWNFCSRKKCINTRNKKIKNHFHRHESSKLTFVQPSINIFKIQCVSFNFLIITIL